jgi:phosphohistidine swiveling domain-containing protein
MITTKSMMKSDIKKIKGLIKDQEENNLLSIIAIIQLQNGIECVNKTDFDEISAILLLSIKNN